MSRTLNLPPDFDSLPESRIDPCFPEDEGENPSTCCARARERTPEVDDYCKIGEKTETKTGLKHNGYGLRNNNNNNNKVVRSRDPTLDERGKSCRDTGSVPQSNVQQLPSSATQVGLEEDYENDENCIITENDLGDITVCGTTEFRDSDFRLTSGQSSEENCHQREADIRRKRKAFYEQMLCSKPQKDTQFEPLESPSQVLKLIQRFQTRINNKGEDMDIPEDTTPMEFSGNETPKPKPAIKKPPRVFPKKIPSATSVIEDSLSADESGFQDHQSDNNRNCQQKPSKTLSEVENNMASMMIEPPEEYKGYDQDALEAIEQLDKSIEEVILSEEEFFKIIKIERSSITDVGLLSKKDEKSLEEQDVGRSSRVSVKPANASSGSDVRLLSRKDGKSLEEQDVRLSRDSTNAVNSPSGSDTELPSRKSEKSLKEEDVGWSSRDSSKAVNINSPLGIEIGLLPKKGKKSLEEEDVRRSSRDSSKAVNINIPLGTDIILLSVKDGQSSKGDVSCQTLTVDTDQLEKSAVSPILTDEGFGDGGFGDNSIKKDGAQDSGSSSPLMTDVAVNTDFETTLEEAEQNLVNAEERMYPDDHKQKDIKRMEYFRSNVVEIEVPKQFRDKEVPLGVKPLMEGEFSALRVRKQWHNSYPVYPVLNTSTVICPNQKLDNGDKDMEEGILESNDPCAERSLKDVEASHRMSTVTLDGAVVAPTEDSTTVFSSATAGHHGHFVVVAIDFGTTFSGYAFSFIRDPDNIHIMRKWEGGDPGVINQKTLTTVLLTPDRKFHSVGFTARDHYHDLDTDEAKRWLYFDKFKMALHHNLNLSEDTEIRATNGTSMAAVTIFAHVLRFFREHALQELSDQSATRILNEDVRWVITVPAIWRQPAKQFMRQAAYQSGIASPDYPDQLLIALEPEAASIYCRKLKIHQLVSESQQQNQRFGESSRQGNDQLAMDELRPGTRYMVVDCGGGTVDITVHEIADDKGNLKELHKPNGGPCGSVMVDAEFENLLNDIFGADFMEQFKTRRPAAYVDLMMAFEARKRNVTPHRNNPSNVSLPFSFVDYYKKCKGTSVETAIKKFGRKDIRWSSQGMLRLEPSAMRQLFARVIEDIKNHVSRVLRATNHTAEYLFLVGGFAESQILQQEIRNGFEGLKIIIPQGVSLAILKGAVLYGREPTVVSVRRSRMTYGVGVLNRFVPDFHPKSKRVAKDGMEWCADVFDRFVTADESVGLGDVVLRSYTPATKRQTNIVLHVYSSEKEDVSFITDEGVCRCGTLHLDLSDVKYVAVPKRREIQARMIFGDTELKVSALDVTTGKCVRARLDFLNH